MNDVDGDSSHQMTPNVECLSKNRLGRDLKNTLFYFVYDYSHPTRLVG